MGSGPIDNSAGYKIVWVNGAPYVLRFYFPNNGPYYQGTAS
jgi:hypothetical protein